MQVAGNHNAGSSSVSGANIRMSGTIVTDIGSGTQTITTPGTLTIQGGGGCGENAGLIHQGSGEQRSHCRESGRDRRHRHPDQCRSLPRAMRRRPEASLSSGNIRLTGGASGDGNQAIIRSAGNQRIDVGADDHRRGRRLTAALGGNNTAFIVGAAANVPGKKQTINAGSITMRSGAGGFQNGAVILGPRQEITTTGDVLLAGSGTGGTLGGVRMGGLSTGAGGAVNGATDLTLKVGNDLLMSGGVTPSNSANIGSTTGQAADDQHRPRRAMSSSTTSPTSVARIGTVLTARPRTARRATFPSPQDATFVSTAAGRSSPRQGDAKGNQRRHRRQCHVAHGG